MNDEEQKDKKQTQGIVNKVEDSAKKAKKVGSKFKMIMQAIAVALPAIKGLTVFVVIATVLTFFGGFAVAEEEKSNKTAESASAKVIKDNINIVKTNDGRYYFKIDKDIINEYIKKLNKADEEYRYNNSETKEDEEENSENEEDEENNEEETEEEFDSESITSQRRKLENIFGTKEFEPYLIKMIRAEFASTYPVLSDYDGESFSEDSQGNKKDKDGNYVGQGIVQIQRTSMSETGEIGSPVRLDYMPEEEFKALIASNDRTGEALRYYTFNEEKQSIYYATYKRVVTNGETTEYKLTESPPVPYKSITSMCSMPYNFLFTLLQESSQNPKWIMKVIDLLLEDEDSEVILMIQDQINVTTEVTKTAQMQRTTTSTSTKTELPVPGEGGSFSTEDVWIGNADASASYSYVNETTTEVITYQNTANVFIRKANTWCVDFEQEAAPEEPKISFTENSPEHSNSEFTFGEGTSSTSESGNTRTTTTTAVSNETVTTYTSTESKSHTCKVNTTTEKKINHEKFLGLWKNEKGKYELGARFDLNGKLVGYELPKDGTGYPANDISTHNGYRIERVLELLRLHEDTQFHEKLMMYFWNKYKDEDIYDVDVDNLLNLFNTNLKPVSGGGGFSVLKEYVRTLEGPGTLNSDGTCFIVVADTIAGTRGIGPGLDLVAGDHVPYFQALGYSTEMGAEIPCEVVEERFEQVLRDKLEFVKNNTAGLNLEEYQIHALTSRIYQMGGGGILRYTPYGLYEPFTEAYAKYWEPERDNKFDGTTTTADFSHPLYTNYLSKTSMRKKKTIGIYTISNRIL